jgi:hypothetical protein
LCNKELKKVNAYSLNKVVIIKKYYKKKKTKEAKKAKAKKGKEDIISY